MGRRRMVNKPVTPHFLIFILAIFLALKSLRQTQALES
jgi:hypothetical protein